MKFTPGPWRASKHGPWIVTGEEDNPKIVLIGSNTVHDQSTFACKVASIEDYNNRILAAAAPDLLKECTNLINFLELNYNHIPSIMMLCDKVEIIIKAIKEGDVNGK